MQSSSIVQYKDRPYHLDLIYNQGIVKVKLKHQNSLYQNSFDKSFIEQLTRKTGNFKKFEIFVEMLFKCCKNEDKILSFSVKEFGEDYDRLYVVLTYSVAYDRVHYPLPLDLYATKSIDIASMNYKTLFNNSVNSKQSLKSSNSKDRQIRQLHIRSPSRKRTNHLNYNSMLRTVIAIKKSVSLRDYASAYRGLEDLENELRRANSNDNESRDYKGIQQRIISSPEPRKYKVIKSEPLTEKPRFKRFDPTE